MKIPAPVEKYSKKELAKMYGYEDPRSIDPWIEKIKDKLGERIGNYYNPLQVEIFFNHYGTPNIEKRSKIIIK